MTSGAAVAVAVAVVLAVAVAVVVLASDGRERRESWPNISPPSPSKYLFAHYFLPNLSFRMQARKKHINCAKYIGQVIIFFSAEEGKSSILIIWIS